jgi:hypothetical protein
LFPTIIFFPVIWQTRDISVNFLGFFQTDRKLRYFLSKNQRNINIFLPAPDYLA